MAKSTRSKVKRSFRSKKREDGIYAATEAARLHRLNTKLVSVISKDRDGDISLEDREGDLLVEGGELPAGGEISVETTGLPDSMELDSTVKRISTHGPKGSRREEWRKSKGMDSRPKSAGMNRQGGIAARRKSGRSHRRR